MYKLCVFGGTTEGRELVEFLNTQPCRRPNALIW